LDTKLSLNFSVDDISFEEKADSRFGYATIHAFASGPNAHTHPIDKDVLMRSAKTIYRIPIICKYDGFVGDFLGHEVDETPIGYVGELDNPITFEESDDGRIFIVIKGTIWTKYASKQIEVMKRDGGIKSVSVEITTIGEEVEGKTLVHDIIYDGITILGDFVRPACKGSKIELEFAENSKKLWEKFEEVFGKAGESEMSENNTNMSQNADAATDTQEDVEIEMSNGCEKQEMSEPEKGEEKPADSEDEAKNDGEENAEEKDMSNEIETQNDSEDGVEVKCAEDTEEPTSKETDSGKDDSDDDKDGEEKQEPENMTEEVKAPEENKENEKDVKIAEMASRINELEEENKAFMAKIAEMSDYEDLKRFKIETEERIAREAEMAEMQEILNSVKEKGCNMSENDEKKLINERVNFSSIDAWKNFVKASMFDSMEDNGSMRIGLPFANPKRESNSIWDKVKTII